MNLITARPLLPVAALAGGLALAGTAFVPGPGPDSAPAGPPSPTPNTIAVTGNGAATVDPGRISVRASVESFNEIAAEAVASFQEARRRVTEGLAQIEGLEIRGLGSTLSYGPEVDDSDQFGGMVVMGMGGDVETPTQGTTFKEEFILTLTGAGDLDDAAKAAAIANLIDSAIDIGMQPASAGGNAQQMVWFAMQSGGGADTPTPALLVSSLSDEARVAAEEEAYAAAMASATRRAGALAKLSGRTLGQVSSIEVRHTSGDWAKASSRCQLTVDLHVVFELL